MKLPEVIPCCIYNYVCPTHSQRVYSARENNGLFKYFPLLNVQTKWLRIRYSSFPKWKTEEPTFFHMSEFVLWGTTIT